MNARTRVVLIALLFSTSSGCGEDPAVTAFEEARVVRMGADTPLQVFLAELAGHYELPAVAAAVVSPDGDIETAVYGVNKTVDGQGLSGNPVFHLGSCGKSITALLAATFVEEGLLSFDSTVAEVFPEFDGRIDPRRGNVTLRDLLSHTAGIQAFSSDQDVFGDDSYLTNLDQPLVEARRSFSLWLLTQEPSSNAEQFIYSNAGYVVAAAMLEKVSGKAYEELLQERLFLPMGLESAITGFAASSDPSQPWRHFGRDAQGVGIPLAAGDREYPAILNPAGNISMSIGDFASYVAFHASGLRGKDGLLPAETLQYLHSPVTRITADEQYALGWYVREIGGVSVSTHSGSDQTIFALMSIDRSSGRSAAVTTNIGGSRAEMALVNAILELLH